ncbi:MAG TPA: helix-turn-helix transcriptional regulator [Candidatus Limnocylindria bacterium]|nr:helix-turn-helix transcriptional regulator [Candidatus Limnocylindria bacterium]
MQNAQLGRVARAIRHRLRWRQEDVAGKARVHRSVVSRLERGLVGNLDVDAVRAIFDALGAKLELRVLWHGPQLDRLLDEAHAALAAAWKSRLEHWAWLVRVEVSYSRYGERGRIDLLAFHPGLRILLVVEVKTDLVDAQGLLGPLDVKARLARSIAADLGWTAPALVVPVVLFRDDSTIHRRVRRLAPLFAGFDRVGRPATSWLRSPSLADAPHGLLLFSNLAYGSQTSPAIGRQRIRASKPLDRVS